MRKMILTLILCSLLVLPVNAAAPTVALTFDDGPSGRFTRALLDGLAERNVKATFFLCGYRIEKFPEIAQRMAGSQRRAMRSAAMAFPTTPWPL